MKQIEKTKTLMKGKGAIYMGSEDGSGAYVGRVTRPLSCPGESKDLF